MTFSTAIVPAAGWGTRFLPATKCVPKELLPIVDTPGIELIAAEAADAGAHRLLIVTSPEKDAVAGYFRPKPELESMLAERGKTELLRRIEQTAAMVRVETVIQERALGLGHAVGCAEPHLTDVDDVVAVLLPDDLILPVGVLRKMAHVRARHGGNVLCAYVAEPHQLSNYGVFDLTDTDCDGVSRVRAVVEKPSLGDAPSRYAVAGRYLLEREVFAALKKIEIGPRGEYDLTDAITLLIDAGRPVHVVVHKGIRHDVGSPAGMLRASVDFALADPDQGPSLQTWLRDRLALPLRTNH
jgi:UTP--glucose-1-phosphate uridylyltransferase